MFLLTLNESTLRRSDILFAKESYICYVGKSLKLIKVYSLEYEEMQLFKFEQLIVNQKLDDEVTYEVDHFACVDHVE